LLANDSAGASPSYGECQATEKRVSGFSSLESNEVAKFFQVKGRADCSL
jgi:hypothetical protein